MLKQFSVGFLLMMLVNASHANDMFSSSSEVSTHDAHCTKQEIDSGRCDRDKRYTENPRPPQVYIDNNRSLGGDRYDNNDRYSDRYNGRDDRRSYDDRRGYDDRRNNNDRYDDRGGRYDDRRDHRRPDPNWKEKHDIRTEDAFERQRRKDQEYYDKY